MIIPLSGAVIPLIMSSPLTDSAVIAAAAMAGNRFYDVVKSLF